MQWGTSLLVCCAILDAKYSVTVAVLYIMIFYDVIFFFMVQALELGVSHMFGKHSTMSYIHNLIVWFRDLKVSSWGENAPPWHG